ncbi:MAG: hypothetical protein JWQ87_116 [Candidatus Sulfotelmatobacter sp.]|nr:hypothetical protein [Candidatus Sulfotelmatobacter sp.]
MPFCLCPFLPLVYFPDVDVEHLAQSRLFRKRITYQVESNIATKRAPRTQEVMLGLGFQD